MEEVTGDEPCSDWPAWTCPDHHLRLVAEGSALACERGERYEVLGGIPRFVGGDRYVNAFGAQWNRYLKTQLDSYSGTTISRDRTRANLGPLLWNDLANKHVAELGCGAGRFTEILLERGACVTSVDLSSAVDANAKNFPPGPRHRIAQADILRLPFERSVYDVAFCLGVIQHTPSPEATIAALADLVKPGGWLVIDHSAWSWSWYTRTAPLARRMLRRLTPERGIRVTKKLVDVFLPLHQRVIHNRPARVALKRVSPITSFYDEYPQLSDEMQREWADLDTHDSLTAWYRHERTTEQIRDVLLGLGFVDVEAFPGGTGVMARGRKPT